MTKQQDIYISVDIEAIADRMDTYWKNLEARRVRVPLRQVGWATRIRRR